MMTFWMTIVGVVTIVGSLLGIATMTHTVISQHQANKFRKYDLQALMKCEAFDTLRSLVQTVVMSIEQEEKSSISTLQEDLRHEKYKEFRELAYERVMDQLSDETLSILADNLQDVDGYIHQLISQQVLLLKRGTVNASIPR